MSDEKISAAIEKLSGYGFEIIEDVEAMKVLFDWDQFPIAPLSVRVVGIDDVGDKPTESPMLTVQILHSMGGYEVIHEFDPIAFLIESYIPNTIAGDCPIDDHEREAIDRAIAAFQSGIDRVKAYEAQRLAAQS